MKQSAQQQPSKQKLAQLSPSKFEDQKLSSKRKTAHSLNKSADLSGISLIQMLNRRNQSTVLGDRLTTGDGLAASKRIRIDFKKDQVFQNIHRPNKQLAAIRALDYTTLLSPKQPKSPSEMMDASSMLSRIHNLTEMATQKGHTMAPRPSVIETEASRTSPYMNLILISEVDESMKNEEYDDGNMDIMALVKTP